MITVAPVHCKYGKTLQLSCFYSRVEETLLWDVYLLSKTQCSLVQFQNEPELRKVTDRRICASADAVEYHVIEERTVQNFGCQTHSKSNTAKPRETL